MSSTIVTCYYKFKSKHSFQDYVFWINNFLKKINNNVVLFTDKKTEELLRCLIENKENIKVLIREIEELPLAKKYNSSFWEKQEEMDESEKHANRTKECFIIWNSKINFVKEAIELNPFNSDKFIWNDIGSLRDKRDVNNYPSYNKISKDKIDIILLNDFPRGFLGKEKFFRDNIYFSGSIFGGGKEIFLKFHDLYYKFFNAYVEKGLFIGCDQQIISSVYLKNPEVFNLIKSNDWFFIYKYYINI
jgi:hypothetical protein